MNINDPFTIAVLIVVFAVVICTIAGIVLANHMWPFVTSREVEITDLDMFDQRISLEHDLERIEVYETLAAWNRLRTRYQNDGHTELAESMTQDINEIIANLPARRYP
jgi:hypothetical protein